MMGVINQKLQQTKNEFISLSDLLISLGEHTQDTLRDILIFLKNENIQKIDLYELKDFQPKKICPPDFPMGTSEILLSELLEQGINTFCIFDYFVFDNSFDFNNLALNPQVFGKVKPTPLGVSDEQEKFLYKLCYQNDLAFKKSDLMQQDWFDEVFLTASDNKANDQQQIADLQAENAHLKAQIAELESQNAINDNKLSYRTENTVGTIIAGLANIAKIDLTQPYSDDSNKRIRKELLRLGFKPNDKDGLPLSSDTVAKWLKIADKLSK